jgi:hypothetical protein
MVVLKLWGGKSFISTPLPLIVVVTFMIAMMCVLLGLLAEMIMRTFYEAQGKPIYGVRSARNFPEPRPVTSSGNERDRAGSSGNAEDETPGSRGNAGIAGN